MLLKFAVLFRTSKQQKKTAVILTIDFYRQNLYVLGTLSDKSLWLELYFVDSYNFNIKKTIHQF